MRRPSIISWLIVIVLTFEWGCTASRPMRPFAWLGGGKGTEKSTAAKEKPKENNPFKKETAKKDDKPATDAAKPETAVASAEMKTETTPDAAKSAAKTETDKKHAVVSHDAETLAIIESELKDLPPAERAKFEQDLKVLDPALVKSLLHSMKLMRQMGQYAPSRVAQASVENPGNVIAQAVTTSPVDIRANVTTVDQGRGTGGLGTVQPWSHQAAIGGTPGQLATVIEPNANNQQLIGLADPGAMNDPMRRGIANPATTLAPLAAVDPRLINVHASPNAIAVDPNAFNSTAVHGQNPQPVAGAMPTAVPNGVVQPVPAIAAPIHGAAPVANAAPGAIAAPGANVAQINGAANSVTPVVPGIQVTGIYAVQPAPPGAANQLVNSQYVVPVSAQVNSTAGKWKEDLDRLIAATEASTAGMTPGTTDAEKQAYLERHVYLRMLYLMAGQQQRALEAIRDINGADQEFWQQVFWALSNYFDNDVMPDPADRTAQTVAQLRSAIQRLEENARLELRNVSFCHKISSFGNYERFQRDEFSPNQDVLVYAEVNNFKSEPTPDGQYRTLLRSTIEIYKAGPAGELVSSLPFDPTPDLCYNHRRDYFHSYVVTIPQNLSLGPYLLKLRVADELSGKMAEYALKFTVK